MLIHNAAITGSLTYNGIDISDITSSEASVASLNSFSSSILSYTASNNTNINALQTFSSSILTYTASNDSINTTQNNRLSSLETTSGSLINASSSFSTRVSSLESFSSSLDSTFATDAQLTSLSSSVAGRLTTDESTITNNSSSFASRLTTDETNISNLQTASGSFSTRVTNNESNISSLQTASGSFSTRVTSNESNITSLNSKTGSYATTGSNTFVNTQYISAANNAISFTSTASLYTDGGVRVSKDLYVSGTSYFNNVTIYGTQSVQYITSSQLNIGTNIINVNTDTPTIRFGGLAVYDSGSTGLTGSMLWDSQDNQWIYSNPSGSTYDSAMFLVGPRNSGTLGNEVGINCNFLSKGNGMHHMTSSGIFEDGSRTCFYGNSFISSSGVACFNGSVTSTSLITTGMSGNVISIQGNETLNSPFGITWTTPTYTGGLAAIRVARRGATDASDMMFFTSPNGDVPNERLRITSEGISCFSNRICATTGAALGNIVSYSYGSIRGYVGDTDGDCNMQVRAECALTIKTGGNNSRLTIDSLGNSCFSTAVGIGGPVLSSSYALTVWGCAVMYRNCDFIFHQPNGYTNGIAWKNTGYAKDSAAIRPISTGAYAIQGLGFYTGNYSDNTSAPDLRFAISPGGASYFNCPVGINIGSPAAILDVRAHPVNSCLATLRIGTQCNGSDGDEFANLEFYWGDPDAAEVKAKIFTKNTGNVGPGGGGAASLIFATRTANAGLCNRFSIDSNGISNFCCTVCSPTLVAGSTFSILGSCSAYICFYKDYSGSPSNPGFVIVNASGTTTLSHNSNGGATNMGGNLLVSGVGCFNSAVCTPLFLASGCIGIGTTSPQSQLHIYNNSAGATFRLHGTRTADGEVGVINFSNITDITGGYIIGSIAVNRSGFDNGGAMIFSTATAASTPTERMRITSAGLIGINTTNFGERLNIGCGGAVAWQNTCNCQRWHIQYRGTEDGLNFVESAVADFRLFLKAGGNVGIGTSPNYKLEVSGNACFTGGVAIGGSYCAFALNVHGVTYQIGGSVWVQNGYGYVNSGAVSTGLFPLSDCTIQLRIANSAALTVDSTQKVGIGTTTPQTRAFVLGLAGGQVGAGGCGCSTYSGGGKPAISSYFGDQYGNGAPYGTSAGAIAPYTVWYGGGAGGYFRGGDGDPSPGGGGAGIVAIGGDGSSYAASGAPYADGGAGIYARGGCNLVTGARTWAGYFDGSLYACGNVGIGTTSPTDKLHVLGADNGITICSIVANRPVLNFINGSTSMLKLSANGIYGAIASCTGDIMFFYGSNIGISTTSPTDKLHVAGSGRFDGRVSIVADAGNEQFAIARASNNNAQLLFGFHSSGFGRIQAVEQNVGYRALALNQDGGNVGIGCTSPGVIFTIGGTDALRLPTGTTNQRPTTACSLLRFNSDWRAFEGAGADGWGPLGVAERIIMNNYNPYVSTPGALCITDNADGGGTTWEFTNSGIFGVTNSSGGHSGQWGPLVYMTPGAWRWRWTAIPTVCDGAIHPNTPADAYKCTINVNFSINGVSTNDIIYDTCVFRNNTHIGGISTPTYITTAGCFTVSFSTNGYMGVRKIWFKELVLEKIR